MSRDVGLKPDRYAQDTAHQALQLAKRYADRAVQADVITGLVLDAFMDLGVYTTAGAGAVFALDATDPKYPSVLGITGAADVTATVRRDLNLDLTGRFVSFDYLPLDANLSTMRVDLESQSRSIGNKTWRYFDRLTSTRIVAGRWHRVTLPLALGNPFNATKSA